MLSAFKIDFHEDWSYAFVRSKVICGSFDNS